MDTVAWVDDDPDLLLLIRRWLGDTYQLRTFESGQALLDAIQDESLEAQVIVADMNMPGMDGAALLARVAEAHPDAVRVMFTGADDQHTAQVAVNEGHVFRFLTKGADIAAIQGTLHAAAREYHDRAAERRVLEDTTIGAVRALMDVLAITQPTAFGRATRIRQTVASMAEVLQVRSWQIELAASLSQLGCIALPALVMERLAEGLEAGPAYQKMFLEHPRVGAELIRKIPRLQPIADIVLFQHKHYDGSGFPEGGRAGTSIPIGARLLKVAVDYDRLTVSGSDGPATLTRMRARQGWYDAEALGALAASLSKLQAMQPRSVALADLRAGMVLAADVCTPDGLVVATRGEQVTPTLAMRLRANRIQGERLAVLAA